MTETKLIESFEDLCIYGYELENGAEFHPIEIITDRVFFTVHIEGASWDKRIDKRTAQYILALQSTIDDLIKEYAPEATGEALVKVDNSDGSWFSEVDFTDCFKILAEKMDGQQSFYILCLFIMAVSGAFFWSRYQKRMENKAYTDGETQKELARQETLRHAFDCFRQKADESPEKFAAFERPVRTLTKTLKEGDSITVCGMPDAMSADIVQKCGPRRPPRSEEQTTYADGNYIVNSRRYDEGEVTLELAQGDCQIKGYLWQLDESERQTFIASIDQYEKEGDLPFSMDLQVNVIHTSKKLKYAIILGEGSPRAGKNCVMLNDILPK